MIEAALDWLKDNQNLSGWFQGITTLLAGIFAIWAGRLAFSGAKAQATAATDAVVNQMKFELDRDERLRNENIRSVAATVWAELLDNRQRLLVIRKCTENTNLNDLRKIIPQIDISIFKESALDIGKLPTDQIIYVIGCYRALDFAKSEFSLLVEAYTNQSDHIIKKKIIDRMNILTEDLIEQINYGLTGIRSSAGIPDDVAESLMESLSRR